MLMCFWGEVRVVFYRYMKKTMNYFPLLKKHNAISNDNQLIAGG